VAALRQMHRHDMLVLEHLSQVELSLVIVGLIIEGTPLDRGAGPSSSLGGHADSLTSWRCYRAQGGLHLGQCRAAVSWPRSDRRRGARRENEPGLKGPKAEVFLVNENDRGQFDSKVTPHPTGSCKADKSWTTAETIVPGHVIMLDAPEWLAEQLLQAASNAAQPLTTRGGQCLTGPLGPLGGSSSSAVYESPQFLGAHAREVAGVPSLDLLYVEAIELPAQLFSPDRRARLSPLVGFVAQLGEHLHVCVES
jgi:hypothetical protein